MLLSLKVLSRTLFFHILSSFLSASQGCAGTVAMTGASLRCGAWQYVFYMQICGRFLQFARFMLSHHFFFHQIKGIEVANIFYKGM